MTSSFTFYLDSDIHYGSKNNRNNRFGIRDDKINNIENMLKLNNDEPCSAVIVAGDLTDSGYNGAKFLCWNYGGTENQVGLFQVDYIDPLLRVIPTYICEGNHDTYVPWPYVAHPVADLIKARHGALNYSFVINGVTFLCCGKYPEKSVLPWLREKLESLRGKPVIVWFHYNLWGPYSDFWTEDEKYEFLKVVNPYKSDIKAILTGHIHESYNEKWEGFTVISGGGEGFMICKYDAKRGVVTSRQQLNTSNVLLR
jgi:DNA repair exonuclease SbcCD nuclease subunit